MRYKVGDKVRVRGDLEVGERYGDDIFTGEMEKYKGKIAKIAKETCVGYELEDFMYNWTFEMLRPAEFKIWCETEEEKQAVLEELEKEGYVWKSGREKPTEPTDIGFFGKKPCGLYIKNDELGWDNSKQSFHSDNMVEFKPSEFTGIDFSEKIIITKTTTGATATYGDKTVTTEGEFDDASRQALAEVLCPFKVGDKVKSKLLKIHGKVEKVQIDGKITVGFSNDSSMNCFDYELEPYTEPLYNAKLFCIKSCGRFEEGHIYEVKNGVFTDGNPNHTMTISNINELNDRFGKRDECYFMEIKGGLDD